MKTFFTAVFLSISNIILAQNIDFSTQTFFSNPISQDRYSDGVFWKNYYMHINLTSNKIVIEKVDVDNKSIEVIYEKTFGALSITPENMGVVDGTFWFLNDNNGQPRPEVIILKLNPADDSFEENAIPIIYGTSNINHSQMINRNDSLILWISTFASNSNLSFIEIQIKDNTTGFFNANNFTISEITQATKVERVAYNDSLMIIAVDDNNNESFAYVTFDMRLRKVYYEIKPYQFNNDFKNYNGFYSKGIVRENGFVNSHKYYRDGQDYNLLLAGYNTDINEWFYSDGDARFIKDSLAEVKVSDYKPGPMTQLPSGEYIATAVVYDDFNETVLNGNQDIKLIVKVFTDDDIPTTKAVYVIDNPMNFSPATVQYINESELILSGYITNYTDRDSIYSNPAYLKLGDKNSLGILQKKGIEKLRFNLNSDQSLLSVFNNNINQIEIFDEWGRKVLLNQKSKITDISHLTKDFYILRVKTKNGDYQQANFLKEL